MGTSSPAMANQMENTVEKDMGTGGIEWFTGIRVCMTHGSLLSDLM